MDRILLVDDDVWLRHAIKLMLTSVGYEVVEAGNGKEALQRAKEMTFDLVLTDIQMPIMDGIELIKALCLGIPEQKVIAITAGDYHRSSQALSSGAREVIEKPFNGDDFLNRIALALNAA